MMRRSLTLLLLFLTVGCSQKGEVGTVRLELVPSTTTNLFRDAQPVLREAAFHAADLVSRGLYPQAWQMYQGLLMHPDINTKQKEFIAAAVVALGAKVSDMAEAGDPAAKLLLQRGSRAK